MINAELRRLLVLLPSLERSRGTSGLSASQLAAVTGIPEDRIAMLLIDAENVDELSGGCFVRTD